MDSSAERIGACGALVAGIFVQENVREKLGGVSGCMVSHSVPIVPSKRIRTVLPFPGILARRIRQLQTGAKGRKYKRGWSVSLVDINAKFV